MLEHAKACPLPKKRRERSTNEVHAGYSDDVDTMRIASQDDHCDHTSASREHGCEGALAICGTAAVIIGPARDTGVAQGRRGHANATDVAHDGYAEAAISTNSQDN